MCKWRFYLQNNFSLPGQQKTPASVARATPGAGRDDLHHFVGDKRDLIPFNKWKCRKVARLCAHPGLVWKKKIINKNLSVDDNGLQKTLSCRWLRSHHRYEGTLWDGLTVVRRLNSPNQKGGQQTLRSQFYIAIGGCFFVSALFAATN